MKAIETVVATIRSERMVKALKAFENITDVPVSEVIDMAAEELLKEYLVKFFLEAMTDIEIGVELRHPDIVTFVSETKVELAKR